MLRAFFRHLPLLASLVVLVLVSLFASVPAASAKNQAIFPCIKIDPLDNYTHCTVALNVTARPLDASKGVTNIGVGSTMQIFTPSVGRLDQESLVQMTACYPSCGANAQFTIEFGWMVARHLNWTYPNGTSSIDASTHLFVFVRSTAAPHQACLVQYDKKTGGWNGQGWTCGWNSNYPNGSTDFPGEVLQSGTTSSFVIVYSNGSWWLGYNNKWIGNVDGSWFGGLFNSVGGANWQGEVALYQYSPFPSTEMGNGYCGVSHNTSNPLSAHIYNMNIAESGFTDSALKLSYLFDRTNSKAYNGFPYLTTDPTYGNPVSNLSYGGPKGC